MIALESIKHLFDFEQILLGNTAVGVQYALMAGLSERRSGLKSVDRDVLDATYRALGLLSQIQQIDMNTRDYRYRVSIGEPAQWLIELYSYVISETFINQNAFPRDIWVGMVAEANIIDFKVKKSDQIHYDVTEWFDAAAQKTLARYLPFCNQIYLSPGLDLQGVKNIVSQYQISHAELVDFIGDKPALFENVSYRNPWHTRGKNSRLHMYRGVFDKIPNPWHDASFHDEIALEMRMDTLMIFDEDDFDSCFDPVVTAFRRDRSWVKDATNARTLLITPTGFAQLSGNQLKRESNSRHEWIHFFMYNQFYLPSVDISAQYLFPRWLKEGVANNLFFVQRGRRDDGFSSEWRTNFYQHTNKTAREIMSNSMESYFYYSLLTYFLMSACISARKGDNSLVFPSVNEQVSYMTHSLRQLNNVFTNINPYRSGPDYQNQIAEAMFDIFFEQYGKNSWEDMTFRKLLKVFDIYINDIIKIYFDSPNHSITAPFDLGLLQLSFDRLDNTVTTHS